MTYYQLVLKSNKRITAYTLDSQAHESIISVFNDQTIPAKTAKLMTVRARNHVTIAYYSALFQPTPNTHVPLLFSSSILMNVLVQFFMEIIQNPKSNCSTLLILVQPQNFVTMVFFRYLNISINLKQVRLSTKKSLYILLLDHQGELSNKTILIHKKQCITRKRLRLTKLKANQQSHQLKSMVFYNFYLRNYLPIL